MNSVSGNAIGVDAQLAKLRTGLLVQSVRRNITRGLSIDESAVRPNGLD